MHDRLLSKDDIQAFRCDIKLSQANLTIAVKDAQIKILQCYLGIIIAFYAVTTALMLAFT